jgi:hypothetical protein
MILSILTLILGGALMFIGRFIRKGFDIIMKFPKDKFADQEKVHRFAGNNILLLGFIGVIAGLALIAGGEDNILLFLAYLVFVVLFVALIKVGAKTFESKI